MATYPTIHGGVITQFPYTENDDWIVAEASVPCGFSYTRPQHTSVLKRFIVSYPAIQSADLIIIEAFWNLMRGTWDEFSFTDDAGTVWTKTRFDMATFSVQYVGPAQYSLEVHLSAEAN